MILRPSDDHYLKVFILQIRERSAKWRPFTERLKE